MRIYLAARYSRLEEMQNVKQFLINRGHRVTSRWLDGKHTAPEGITKDAKRKLRVVWALEDIADIRLSDAIVEFTEPPRSICSRGGRHVELGIAMQKGLKLFIVGPRENIFHELPRVKQFKDYSDFLNRFIEMDNQ